MGDLLRIGVILAATVVLLGGFFYLLRNGFNPADYRQFRSPSACCNPVKIVVSVFTGWHTRAIIQLGLLLLIATPVARVIFSVFAFSMQRDWMYVVITLIVLSVLLYSLLGAAAGLRRLALACGKLKSRTTRSLHWALRRGRRRG